MSFLGKLFGKVGRGIVKGAEVAGEVAIAAASAQAQADEDAREQQREFGDDFRNPGIVVGYVLAMFFLGMHLRHGITSSIQSLGLMPESWTSRILRGGIVLALVIAGLFAVIPIAVYFGAIR